MAPVASPPGYTPLDRGGKFYQVYCTFIVVIDEVSGQISFIQSKIRLLNRCVLSWATASFCFGTLQGRIETCGPSVFFLFFFEKDFFVFADLLTSMVFAALSPGTSPRDWTPLFTICELGPHNQDVIS